MPSPLYGYRQSPLMFSASTSPTTRRNPSSIRYILAQFNRVFIVYLLNLLATKGTNLTLRYVLCSSPFCTPRSISFLCNHAFFSYFQSGLLNSNFYSVGTSSGPRSLVLASSSPPSGRVANACLSRNITLLAIISGRECFCPSWVSQVRVCSLPSA